MTLAIKSTATDTEYNVGYLLPFAGKCNGLYLFGEDEASSVLDRTGKGNDLAYSAGSGGVTYGDGYADLGAQSKFVTPFNVAPRNFTILMVSCDGFEETIYDGDNQYRFPPTVNSASGLVRTYSRTLELTSDILLYPAGSSRRLFFEDGPLLEHQAYTRPMSPMAFQDGSWHLVPWLIAAGHGPDRTYGYWQCSRDLDYAEHVETFTGAAPTARPLEIQNSSGEATSHQHVFAVAVYEYLEPSEAEIAAAALSGIVEARGWQGFSRFPEDG